MANNSGGYLDANGDWVVTDPMAGQYPGQKIVHGTVVGPGPGGSGTSGSPSGNNSTEAIVHTDGGPKTGTQIYSDSDYIKNYLVSPPAPNPALQNLQPPGPNEAQKWFDAHKALWDQPGPASKYFTDMQGILGQPGVGEKALTNILPDFLQPGAAETGIGNLLPTLAGKTDAETMFETLRDSGAFTTPGAAEKYLKDHLVDFERAGVAEKFFDQFGNVLTQPGELEKHMPGLETQIGKARAGEDFFNNYLLPGVTKRSYLENAADKYDPNALSYSEQFLLGGGATGGLDKVFGRLQDVQNRSLDETAAARGGFNSGAALRLREESMRDMDAAHVKALQDASTQADIQKMARTAEGRALLTGADASTIARLGLGVTGAGAADTSVLGRTNALGNLYTGVSDERRGNITAAGTLAKNAQDAALARILGGSTVSLNADQAKALRENLGITAAGASTKGFLDRTGTSADLFAKLQAAHDERLGKYADISKGIDTLAQGRYGMGGTLSANAGTEAIQKLAGGQTSAGAVTTASQTALRDYFEQTFGVSKAEAETTAAALGAIRADQAAAVTNEINLMLKGGQLDAQNAAAATNYAANLIKGGMELSQAVATVKQAYGKAGAGSTGGGSTTNTDKI